MVTNLSIKRNYYSKKIAAKRKRKNYMYEKYIL